MKNSFFDSLFLVNFRFSLRIFCVFERVSCVAFYIKKIGGLERLSDDVGFIPNLKFNAENLPFIVSGTLACVHMPMYAYACIKLAYTGLGHAYAYTYLRTHALGFLWPLVSKNSFI